MDEDKLMAKIPNQPNSLSQLIHERAKGLLILLLEVHQGESFQVMWHDRGELNVEQGASSRKVVNELRW